MTGPVRAPCDELAIRARADARTGAASGRPAQSWVLTAAILGSSLAFIDSTVVNVALPSIQRELRATVTDVQWIVEAYLLFLSALLLVGGALGDRFGRRRVFAIGVATFTIASAACALARDVPQLVAARSLQGIGAALLVPGSLALIGASFRDAERGRAIGTWSAFSAITTALGPLVGGWLVAHSWRWAFLLNLPLGLAVLAILALRVPESRDDEAVRLDLPGTALVTAALGGIVYGLLEWGRAGAPAPLTLLSLALGALSLLLFVIVESRSPHPIVPLALFRSRTFAGANLLTLFLYGALGSVFFFLPLDLIQVHGYSPAAAGAAILPFVALLGGLSRWSGSLAERFGPRIPLVIGPALSAVGFALFARPGTSGSYWTTFFPAVVVLGLGMSITVAPLSTTVLGAVPGHRVGVASGINNAVARIGGLLAVALAGLLVTGTFERELDALVPEASVRPEIRRTVLARSGQFGALEPPASATGPERALVRAAVPEAFTEGFRAQAWAAALCALLSAVTAAFLIEPLQRKRPLPKAEVVARKDGVPQVSDTRP